MERYLILLVLCSVGAGRIRRQLVTGPMLLGEWWSKGRRSRSIRIRP